MEFVKQLEEQLSIGSATKEEVVKNEPKSPAVSLPGTLIQEIIHAPTFTFCDVDAEMMDEAAPLVEKIRQRLYKFDFAQKTTIAALDENGPPETSAADFPGFYGMPDVIS